MAPMNFGFEKLRQRMRYTRRTVKETDGRLIVAFFSSHNAVLFIPSLTLFLFSYSFFCLLFFFFFLFLPKVNFGGAKAMTQVTHES